MCNLICIYAFTKANANVIDTVIPKEKYPEGFVKDVGVARDLDPADAYP